MPAVGLFVYRFAGMVAFEISDARILLFFFPNLFENWFLYVLLVERFWPRLTPRSLPAVLVPLALLLIPKLAQPFLLHVLEAQPWGWIRHHFLPDVI